MVIKYRDVDIRELLSEIEPAYDDGKVKLFKVRKDFTEKSLDHEKHLIAKVRYQKFVKGEKI